MEPIYTTAEEVFSGQIKLLDETGNAFFKLDISRVRVIVPSKCDEGIWQLSIRFSNASCCTIVVTNNVRVLISEAMSFSKR